MTFVGSARSDPAVTTGNAHTAQEVEATSRLAAIVESSDDAMIGKTLDGVITTWNSGAARMYGYAAEEVVGRNVSILIPAERPNELLAILQRVARGERVEHYETQRRRKTGATFDASVSISPIRDRSGVIVGASTVTRDITDRKRADANLRDLQERLHQVQRLESLGQLAGGIAHDFNNLLAGIMNYSALASDGLADLTSRLGLSGDETVVTLSQDVAEITNVATRAARLTHQLLIFSNRDLIKSEILDVNAVVIDMERLLRRTIGESIRLETELAPDLPRTRGDRGQMEQVLMNLAINSRDAMPDGGTLRIETATYEAEDGQYVRLLVSDTGRGMPQEVAARAFEPFFTTKAKGEGTGLGLATVYGIVTQSGGSVVISSQPQLGTQVDVKLPTTHEVSSTPPEAPSAMPIASRGATVLLVEDEAMVREPTRRILMRYGYAVLAASSAEEALRVAEEWAGEIDLLLTDVIMPGRSGQDLAADLSRTSPRTKVLYMSGYTSGVLGFRAVAEAGLNLIEKPFASQELLQMVHEILNTDSDQSMQRLGTDRPAKDPAIKVLIVDDDATFSRSMGRILANAGYDCRTAANSADARERLTSENDIAAVLCDVRMPAESGLDLVATLAADFSDVAIVMTTGVDDPATAGLAFEMGAYGYLIKPFTPNEILITLAGVLRRRELETTRRSQIDGLEQSVARLRTLHGVVADIETAAPSSPSVDETEIIERLSRAVSLRTGESTGHIERMSRYATALAQAVGYRDLSLDELRLANALHDVGKVGVPDTVLLKTGALSPEDTTAMQRHAQIGYQLLSRTASSLLEIAGRIALGHHEWWNGGGYPRGLQGEEIPVEARMAAVADVFDTLTSNRAQGPGVGHADAFEMMTELRGRQFEPRLLDAFVELRDELAAIMSAYPDRERDLRVRVLVVDDDETFMESVLRLLGAQPTIHVVGCAATAREAERVAVAQEPDVVLMGFDLPDGDGVKATEAIKALVPTTKVVMLTGRTDQQSLIRAIGAGCAGFVAKTDGVEKLVGAIRSAQEGEAPAADTDVFPRLLAQLRPTNRGLGSDLGPREVEVLRLMATGMPNKALAQELYVSLNTVRNHVQSVLRKLGAHSKLEAVATAVREGVIERDDPVGWQGRI